MQETHVAANQRQVADWLTRRHFSDNSIQNAPKHTNNANTMQKSSSAAQNSGSEADSYYLQHLVSRQFHFQFNIIYIEPNHKQLCLYSNSSIQVNEL